MLRQVEEHLDAVREIRGGRRSTRAPACDERDVGQVADFDQATTTFIDYTDALTA